MKRVVNIFTSLALIISFMQVIAVYQEESVVVNAATKEISKQEADKARTELTKSLYSVKTSYSDYIKNSTVNYALEDVTAQLISPPSLIQDYHSKAVKLDYSDKAVYEVVVPAAGFYYINIDYFAPDTTMSDVTMNLKINGQNPFEEAKIIRFPIIWKDDSRVHFRYLWR